ncbi:unnamed protein product [Rangifer tarandus platyrhynchus]|uniref:Uncharacterized protein n=1 Tax=Rangifer tarandus platyrhynchus TaxID=3082113 RepID=A0AC59YDX3_RANTA
MQRTGFATWAGKIPHAVGQPSLCHSTEPVHPRAQCKEKPVTCNEEQPLLAAAWESLHSSEDAGQPKIKLAPEHLCSAGHWAGSSWEREVKSFRLQEVMSVDVLTGLGVQGQRNPDPPGGNSIQPGVAFNFLTTDRSYHPQTRSGPYSVSSRGSCDDVPLEVFTLGGFPIPTILQCTPELLHGASSSVGCCVLLRAIRTGLQGFPQLVTGGLREEV